MIPEAAPPRSLRDMELEVEAEGREWMRRRLEEKLQTEASRHGGVPPPRGRKVHHWRQEPMHLRSTFGVVALNVWHGKDPADGRWGCPIRQRWGLRAHRPLRPALEDKLALLRHGHRVV